MSAKIAMTDGVPNAELSHKMNKYAPNNPKNDDRKARETADKAFDVRPVSSIALVFMLHLDH